MADRVIFVCILVLAGLYFWATEQLPSLEIGDPLGPKAFPRLLGVALLVTAVILLFEMIRGRKPASSSSDVMPPKAAAENVSYPVVAAVSVWTFLFFLVFEPLGYVIAASIYLIVLTAYFHRGKWVMNVTTSIAFSLGSYLMFTKVLGVNLAHGILPF
jgi:putative tricarboxylic transport membrane protein